MDSTTQSSLLETYSPLQLNALVKALSPDERKRFGLAIQGIRNKKTWDLICKRESSFSAGPLLWLTEYTRTEDEHWLTKNTSPVAPFPKKDYFVPVMEYFLKSTAVFVPKSREMMTSWLGCGYITHMCMTLPHIFWLVQTEKEDKVTQLINYCRILNRYQPDWMKAKNPLVGDNVLELKWRNGSHILGLPKGVNQMRMYHPYGYLMDEAAFLPEAEQCYNVVRPVAKQIIAISSDGMGWFHDQCNLYA